ncbi:MAG: pilin [Patescibacteria group bacterium]
MKISFIIATLSFSTVVIPALAAPDCTSDIGGYCANLASVAPAQKELAQTGLEFLGVGPNPTLSQLLAALYKFGIGIAGIGAFLMIVAGGVRYMASAGNPHQIGEARKMIRNAFIGLAIALLSFLILYTINPDLVRVGANIQLPALPGASSSQAPQQPQGPVSGNLGDSCRDGAECISYYCNPSSLRCEESPTTGTRSIGQSCDLFTNENQCASSQCITDPNDVVFGICTSLNGAYGADCIPNGPSNQCQSQFTCEATAASPLGGTCRGVAISEAGQSCSSPAECATGVCENNICHIRIGGVCDPLDPGGFCEQASGGCAEDPLAGPGQFFCQ